MLTAAGVTATDGCYYLRGGLFGELLFPVKNFILLLFYSRKIYRRCKEKI